MTPLLPAVCRTGAPLVDIVHCVDALELLRALPDGCVDAMITDPPYGIKMDKGFQGFQGFGGFGKPIKRRRYNDTWDAKRPEKAVFDEMLRCSRLVIIFGGNFFADLLPQSTHWIVWDKLNTMPSFGDCELIWTNSPRQSVKKIIYEYNGLIGKEKARHHPTQKPVGIIQKIILQYTRPGDVILDPFCGSGTTALAARNTGRRYICGDSSPEYVAIAKQRLSQPFTRSFLDTPSAGEASENHTQESLFQLEVKS